MVKTFCIAEHGVCYETSSERVRAPSDAGPDRHRVPRGGLRRAGLVIAGCDAVLYGTGASRRPVATNRVGGTEERPQEW